MCRSLFSYCLTAVVFLTMANAESRADQLLQAQRSAVSPEIDGLADEEAWNGARGIVTRDVVADIPVELKSIYSDDTIFFLVRFPDPDESRSHRSWLWDEELQEYEAGADREDVFVLKWFLEGDDSDLSLSSPNPYSADVWFWKACRTDPAGYADDKIQHLFDNPVERSLPLVNKAGTRSYLVRSGDSGSPAYKTRVVIDNEGALVPRFAAQQPVGSRADIRAKGHWADGFWTIEFARLLRTGYADDVQLDSSGSYRFGVSRYEIAGRKTEPETSQPLFGCGEISEILTLEFSEQETDRAK